MDTMVEENNVISSNQNSDMESQQDASPQPNQQGQQNPQQITTMVMTTIPNQPVQVQSVIQPNNQQSVIQTAAPPMQSVQVTDNADENSAVDAEDSRKRREILNRRPSYRKIYNELSSDAPGVPKIEEEPGSAEDSEAATNITSLPNFATGTSAAQTIQIAAGDGIQQAGLQTLTMTNAHPSPGTIVQYSQSQDGSQQFFVPAASADGSGTVQAYQIRTAAPSTLAAQGVMMAPQNTGIQSQQQMAEEASRKRELRLMKNREAARECRRKKKEYVKCLENRVAVLENQNKQLIEELKTLKDLYCHKSE